MQLNDVGDRADLTCSAAPVQVEGRLPGGEKYYFRARHGEVCLAVGGVDPSNGAAWERCEDHPDASYLPAGDGLAIMRRLAWAYAGGGTEELASGDADRY
jgi:hypothetical protein